MRSSLILITRIEAMNEQYGGRSAASRLQYILVGRGRFEDNGFGWRRCPCGW